MFRMPSAEGRCCRIIHPSRESNYFILELSEGIRVFNTKEKRISGTQVVRNDLAVKNKRFSQLNQCFSPKNTESRTFSRPGLVGEGGFAFLRKSHGGCDSPPDCRQEPPFESTFQMPKHRKTSRRKASRLSGGGRWIRRRSGTSHTAYIVV